MLYRSDKVSLFHFVELVHERRERMNRRQQQRGNGNTWYVLTLRILVLPSNKPSYCYTSHPCAKSYGV